MCSRGVFQLKKLSLFFCDYGGSSTGVRQMITSPKLQNFISQNPQIQLQVVCRRNKHPHVRGNYINGYNKSIPLRNYAQDDILQTLQSLKNQLGRKSFKINGSRVYGSVKSIQGKWQPNLFNKYPIGQLTKTHKIPDVPQQKIQTQDPKRNIRKIDITNYTRKSRQFIDPHRENM